ncbi:MAG: TadE/TadG family type IV pilus assembly protein [Sphingomicrobium sp.]
MKQLLGLLRSKRGAAAVEMALVVPLLLIIMMGSFELGNYFMDEHKLVKAVRDGARYAGRQPFGSFYTCPSTVDNTGTTAGQIRNVVRTGLLTGGSNRIVNWTDAQITISLTCPTTANSVPLSGIYRGSADGAPVVTVSASVPYTPVLASYGFRGVGFNLNATQQAAVMGL